MVKCFSASTNSENRSLICVLSKHIYSLFVSRELERQYKWNVLNFYWNDDLHSWIDIIKSVLKLKSYALRKPFHIPFK